MSALSDLKAATSLSDLAKLIGYKPSALAFVIHQIPAGSKYFSFTVPKKSGGLRLISAPAPKLKTLQQHLTTLLTKCRKEIDDANKRQPLSHAFAKGSQSSQMQTRTSNIDMCSISTYRISFHR